MLSRALIPGFALIGGMVRYHLAFLGGLRGLAGPPVIVLSIFVSLGALTVFGAYPFRSLWQVENSLLRIVELLTSLFDTLNTSKVDHIIGHVGICC